MNMKQVMALAIVTLGVAATAQADVVNNNPETDYVFKRFQEGKSGYYGLSPIADIGNPSAKKKYEADKAREAAEARQAKRGEKSYK
jgi:hypothetical protein